MIPWQEFMWGCCNPNDRGPVVADPMFACPRIVDQVAQSPSEPKA
jgi:hypothetical protein